jgi:hypothetical protein
LPEKDTQAELSDIALRMPGESHLLLGGFSTVCIRAKIKTLRDSDYFQPQTL